MLRAEELAGYIELGESQPQRLDLAVSQARQRLCRVFRLIVRPRQGCASGRRRAPGDARRRNGGSGLRHPVKLKVTRIALSRHRLAAPDAADICDALLAQNALDAADGVALAIEQRANAFEEIDIIGTIKAPA